MANAAQVLQQAHDLIEAGDYQAARQILDAVRSSNENNPDFWWVYAHAVDDAAEGKAAIERVRQLAPNYAGLESLAAGTSSPVSTIKPLRPLAPPPPPMTAKAASDEDEFGDTGEESEKKSNPLMPILGGMLLVLLIAIILITVVLPALNNNNASATPERTAIVDDFATPIVATSDSQAIDLTESVFPSEEAPIATEEVVETQAVETEELATATEEEAEPTATEEEVEPTATEEEIVATEAETEAVASSDITEVTEELADFGVPSEGIIEEDTSLGETLIVTTCTTPGPAASGNILGILDAFKAAGVNLSAEAIAFNVTDCTSDNVIISLGVSSEIVESYWLGDTTAAELLAALRRL